MKREQAEVNPWDVWIFNNRTEETTNNSDPSSYDLLLEVAVSSYDLKNKYRGMDFMDVVQYACRWWYTNKSKMKKYTTYQSVGDLMGGKDHASIYHQVHFRKQTANYKQNTECIRDLLES